MASTKNNCCRRLEERIDQFESEMLQMIKDISIDARQNLRRLMIERRNGTRQHYSEITSGSDLDRLINNLDQIKEKLTEMSSTQKNETDIHVHPVDWTDASHINVKDYEDRIDDMSEVVTVPINESEETNIVSNDNLKLKLTEHSPKMTIDIRSGPYPRLATSDHHLLHCTLDEIRAFDLSDIDQQTRVFWNEDDWILDICYSTLLKLFFIWSNSGFHTFDPSTMEKQQTINNIPDTGTGWYRCICLNDILLLSYDGDIEQRKIDIEAHEYVLVNEWKSIVKNENEMILCMKMNELRVALGIGEYGRTERFELHDHQMNILHTLNMNVWNVASLLDTKWLIVIKLSNKLIVINNDGEIEETIQYNCRDSILDAIICGSNTLLIEICNQLHFHDI